ncbi:DinB family protein [Galbibacter pacificus]|uniref:Damage-inducible protein DinB n=1 Tax=Galbibacter pacificus TaxID=2996052 RepID=A0ABT6FV10_9FLAO|nr:DinB family protein [Galbibacter pacificus]MDG3583425.1 DinB family protein [Galbibacter pacificus]MDG3587098.1 damage-inducible protein DinB [Galbibacter pacificus]
MENSNTSTAKSATVMTPEELFAHWQGHRDLTRRTIEAFPEKEFFTYSIGGMRTFAEMVMELLAIASPGIKEIVTGKTEEFKEHVDHKNSKKVILELWDKTTGELNEYFPKIKEEDFHKAIKSFGQYEGTVQSSIFYFIDNEIHHRGQGFVYLRSLNIEPPFFWERDK